MCTASWIQDPERLTLFFNRDESRDRPNGLPPRVSEKKGVRVIAPRDRLAGGTWVVANDAGCAAVLLNHYPEDHSVNPRVEHASSVLSQAGSLSYSRPSAITEHHSHYPEAPTASDKDSEKWTSRGKLLLELADCRKTENAESILRERVFSACFQPFHLLWFAPGHERALWTWDGHALAGPTHPSPPVTTSAWNARAVRRERLRLFAERIGDWKTATPEDLEACHMAPSPKGASFGVLMDRDDARTVSLCRVDIDPCRVRMTYWPRLAGGRFGSPDTAEIPRAVTPTRPQQERISSCP